MGSLAAQFYSPSLELILLVIAIAAESILAFAVFQSNIKSASNRIFALLSIVTIFWLCNNYITNHITSFSNFSDLTLFIQRLGIFFAAPMSALFFLLAHTIPSDTLQMKRPWFWFVIALTVLMMALNISPFAYVDVSLSSAGAHPQPGPGLLPFSVISTLFSVLAVYWLIRKFRRSKDVERFQLKFVLIGMLIMLGLIIATVLVPIILFNSLYFLAFTPIYTFVFLGMTAYAITKYQLFDIKVLLTKALSIVICLVLFAKLFGEGTVNARTIDALVLTFMLVFSFFLIRSVRREVEQRREIQKLSEEKSEFMTFASHEIRNPITAMRGYASLIADGTTGEVGPKTKEVAQTILIQGNDVLNLIAQYLSKSKMELGQISYAKAPFDMGAVVMSIASGYKPHAEQKGLTLNTAVDPAQKFVVVGDEGKVKEVIGNIVDNSLKYTKQGGITISVERHGVSIRAVVSDTGVGIPPETLPQLFKKFSRADAQKVNLLGTGIGLYLAKTFIEAQGAHIWAESDGKDKGSRFIIEFPAA